MYKRPPPQMDFSKAVKRYREVMGWTPKALAKQTGVSEQMIRNMEKRNRTPNMDAIIRFREATGIDLYIMAYVQSVDMTPLTPRVQKALTELRDAWNDAMERMRANKMLIPSRSWLNMQD